MFKDPILDYWKERAQKAEVETDTLREMLGDKAPPRESKRIKELEERIATLEAGLATAREDVFSLQWRGKAFPGEG